MKGGDKKFSVGEGKDIEQNIKKLQRELGDLQLNGAPEVLEEGIERQIKRVKLKKKVERQVGKKVEKPVEKAAPVIEPKQFPRPYEEQKPSGDIFGLFKNTKFYIIVFGVLAFSFVLIKMPVFHYTTPARYDSDFAGIDVGFKYYNNIFGQQTRSKTIVHIGKEKVEMPISMDRWVNLSKEKKLTAIDYYRKK